MKVETKCGDKDISMDIRTLKVFDKEGNLILLLDEEGGVFWNDKHNNN